VCRCLYSWQADPAAKWDTLEEWCTGFRQAYGRWPLLWIDKCCVDPSNVRASISCLPVFISACNTMLVLYDETLLGRLWCVLEIFAFFTTAAHAGGTFVVLPLKPRSTLPPPAHSLPSPTKPATPVRSTIRRSTASVSSLESGGEAWRSSFLDMLAVKLFFNIFCFFCFFNVSR